MRESDHPGYILRRQDYGDTSMLVDVFTRGFGRFRVVAKGVRSGKGNKSRLLQPFSPMLLGWSGRSELKTLTQIEPTQNLSLDKQAAICGFYINELLWNFLEVHDPHEDLFDAYQRCLVELAEEVDLELALRKFEFFLLRDIGYETILDIDAESGESLASDKMYRFELERGLISSIEKKNAYPGHMFMAISAHEFSDPSVRKLAKKLTRQIIHHRMEGRELHSRKWFKNSN